MRSKHPYKLRKRRSTTAGLNAPLSSAPTPTPPESVPSGFVLVERGDTLKSIAAKTLGSPHRWNEIQSLNLITIINAQQNLSAMNGGWIDTTAIYEGMLLRVPSK